MRLRQPLIRLNKQIFLSLNDLKETNISPQSTSSKKPVNKYTSYMEKMNFTVADFQFARRLIRVCSLRRVKLCVMD